VCHNRTAGEGGALNFNKGLFVFLKKIYNGYTPVDCHAYDLLRFLGSTLVEQNTF
jgi:hypothetical protein